MKEKVEKNLAKHFDARQAKINKQEQQIKQMQVVLTM